MTDIETEDIKTRALQVGDIVLSWGNMWRKCLSISTNCAISEYQLEGEAESHRHSWQVSQRIQRRPRADS